MKKIQISLLLIFQFLFFAQAQNDRFILAWYDYFRINESIDTIARHYKNMQTHYFNCAIEEYRLICLTIPLDSSHFQYAYKNPSKAFLDSAYKYNIKVLLTTPDNSLIAQRRPTWIWLTQYNSITCQQGLNYWGNHPALWGFSIYDEPYEISNYLISLVLPYVNAVRAFNPNLLRFINLPPRCGDMNSISDYEQFIQAYIDHFQPNILSFDHYPIHSPPGLNWYNGLFMDLDPMARKSVSNEIPFIYVLSSLKSNGTIFSEYATSYYMRPLQNKSFHLFS